VSLTPITSKSLRYTYLVPLVVLPRIIDGPGRYVTRCGETAEVTNVSDYHWKRGRYLDCGTPELWHNSGRIFAGQLSNNDIISKAP
jgi:hypothetical protein